MTRTPFRPSPLALLVIVLAACPADDDPGSEDAHEIVFAVIGDFGEGNADERAVADLVNSWSDVRFVLSLGDNNYGDDTVAAYEDRVCGYYPKWVKPVTSNTACSAAVNAFFPTPGNHDSHVTSEGSGDACRDTGSRYASYAAFFDWPDRPQATAPEDFRDGDMFYRFTQREGDLELQFYAFNANCAATDKHACNENSGSHGCSNDGCSGGYRAMADEIAATQKRSNAAWSLVYLHQTPFAFECADGPCGDAACQGIADLDFASQAYADGANRPLAAVLTAHNHNYGRFTTHTNDQVPYYVIGTSGTELDPCPERCTNPDGTSSALCHTGSHGAMRVTATHTTLTFDYYTVGSPDVVDRCTVTRQADGSQRLSCATPRDSVIECSPGG